MMGSKEANDIFQILPDDLIGEIVSHLRSIDLYFSIGRVSKNWRRLCFAQIWKDHEELMRKFNLKCSGCKELDDLLMTSDFEAMKFIKYLMRRNVFEFACKLAEIATISENQLIVSNNWIDEELSILKGYFNEFHIGQNTPIPKQVSKTGLFENAFKFIGSFFSKSSSSSNSENNKAVTNSSTKIEPIPKKSSCLVKVLLDGGLGAGKSSFMTCIANDTPVNTPSHILPIIGVDFCIKQFKIGKEEMKLQLWDSFRNERVWHISSAYYRATSVILLLGNPYSSSVKQVFDFKKGEFAKYATDPEVVLITTMRDQSMDGTTRFLSLEEADSYAFENFNGGLHFHISNISAKDHRNIILYSVLMKYLLLENNKDLQ